LSALKYTVGIIHYRDPAAIEKLLSTMTGWSLLPVKVVIADNSGDLATSVLDAAPEGVRAEIVSMGSNLGYAGAANELLSRAAGFDGAVLLLTQDADLAPDSAALLASTLADNPAAAVAAPMLLFTKDRTRIFSAGGVITRRGRTLHPEQGEDWNADKWEEIDSMEVDWADGACLMLRPEAVRDVGMFDPSFFLYVEEVELQFRLRLNGHKVLLNPAALAYQQPGPYSLYYKYRNLPRFTRMHRDHFKPWPWLVALPKDSLRMTGQGRFSEPLWALRGLLDHVRGASGPRPQSLLAPRRERSGRLNELDKSTAVVLVAESDPAGSPPGIRRRHEHVASWLGSRQIPFTSQVLLSPGASDEGKALRFLRVLRQRRQLQAVLPANASVMFLGLGAVHMLLLAADLARSGRDVWYDTCDSWWMQLRSRARTRSFGTVAPALAGLVVQLIVSRRLSVSYISERDRRSDRLVNNRRRSAVIRPAAPVELLQLPNLRNDRPTRAVMSADFTAFHNSEGVAAVLDAWPTIARASHVELQLFGKGVESVPSRDGVRAIGWSESIADIYDGATLVVISNVGGSGMPNKLIDAVAAQRPIVLHESMRVLLRPHPWLFFYSSPSELEARCSDALLRQYTFDPTDLISLREPLDA
jgi:GT2 family glycosyltransferase